MLVCVAAGLVEQDHLIHVRVLELPQLAPDRLGRADQSASRLQLAAAPPLLVLVPQVQLARLHGAVAVVELERELEEGPALGPFLRLGVGLGALEPTHHGDRRIGDVVAQLLEPVRVGVVVRVHPGLGHVGRQELEAERSHAAPARHPDRLELSEGGFDRSRSNHHAYEAIVAESVSYAAEHGLEAVGYGGIWNDTKDRYTEKAGRESVYLLQLYPSRLQYRLFGDRLSAWGFRRYFGGRFAGATADTTIESRQSRVP